MLAPNRAEWLLTQFGSAYAGLILVNINPAYRLSELEYALNKVGCRALITETQFKSSDYIAMLQSLAPELATAAPGDLHAERLPELRAVIQLGARARKRAHRRMPPQTFSDSSRDQAPKALPRKMLGTARPRIVLWRYCFGRKY